MITIPCPECGQKVKHEHGYLVEHHRDVVRGALLTGSTLCIGSNSKPRTALKTVIYTGHCPGCGEYIQEQETEEYPGSLNKYGGSKKVPHCTTEDFGGIQVFAVLHDLYVIAEPA